MAKPKKMSLVQRLLFTGEKLLEPILYSKVLNKRLASLLRQFNLGILTRLLENILE
ncbi:MAG TPA: hypothetical protein VMV49_05485 [Candidatus Deferrimicrobium sp.]|nr:hypothetical protein [Candidatus Deferrimicrobium sp.]